MQEEAEDRRVAARVGKHLFASSPLWVLQDLARGGHPSDSSHRLVPPMSLTTV